MDKSVINDIFHDIPSSSQWINIEQINKGWSKDKKYYIKNNLNEKFLLRIADFNLYDIKKKEFESMKEIYNLDINMSCPIDFGICGQGRYVYSLLSWIDGEAADEVLKKFSYEEQYNLGVEAGNILRRIHTVWAPIEKEPWEEKMSKKIYNHLRRYKEGGVKVLNDEFAINHINNNIHLLKNRSQKYQHGDFHIGNLIITPNNTLGVIDFNRWDYGDPYEEFYKTMIFNREVSIPFATGQINGYFKNNIPKDFFSIVSLYLADVILFSVAWAIPFGNNDVDKMIKRAEIVLDDYDNFNLTVPKWFTYKTKYNLK